jgi:hypothetical protein
MLVEMCVRLGHPGFCHTYLYAQILQKITRRLRLLPDVDLDSVAERTNGFSGADLQALIYNATLESIHSSLEPKSISLSQDLPPDITYTVLGAPLEKARSKADESAFQKQVTGAFVCLFAFLLKPYDKAFSNHQDCHNYYHFRRCQKNSC